MSPAPESSDSALHTPIDQTVASIALEGSAVGESPSPTKTVGPRLMDKKWEEVQKKTFTKWVNMQLEKGRLQPVESLAKDFSDGVKLIQLLEIIGDETLGKYYKAPKFRIQMCENVNKALEFIKTRGVSLTNIGAEDLVDRNEKLVLGMIWTIILRFSIAEINQEGLTAKEGLLLWCQRKTAGYKNVSVKDFTFSFQDGLALCALIHRHRPDLLDFDKLNKVNKRENVSLALEVAEKHLNIPKLFDPEDLSDIMKPDERSVMTYVAQYFHAFSTLDKFEVAGRRVGKFAIAAQNSWEMQNDYESRVRKLLDAIAEIREAWSSATFDGSFSDAKNQSNELTNYKNTLKREWVTEKRDLDTLLGNIQTKLATYNLRNYTPPIGFTPIDVDNAWGTLIADEARRRKVINENLQSIKEKLRRDYSDLANNFETDLNALSLALGSLNGDLDDQLSAVRELDSQWEALEQRLNEIKAADAECEAAGLDDSEREYTVFSFEDLVFDFGVVKQSLKKKIAFLENQAVARKMTNVTPEQLEQFESTFKMFDKDNTNRLQDYEFKAVMASLGQYYDDKTFQDTFIKVSGGNNFITFEQFTKFMISLTEDKTTPDQLLESFEFMAGEKGYVTESDLRTGQVPADQVEYLKTVLPPYAGVADAYDYKAYLSQVRFSVKILAAAKKKMQQLALIPSGAQPWHKSIAGSFIGRSEMETTKFAYSSTLATYIFELAPIAPTGETTKLTSSTTVSTFSSTIPHQSPSLNSNLSASLQSSKHSVQLCKIISEFEFGNTISMDWSPHQPSELVLANTKNQINFFKVHFDAKQSGSQQTNGSLSDSHTQQHRFLHPSQIPSRARPRIFSRDIDTIITKSKDSESSSPATEATAATAAKESLSNEFATGSSTVAISGGSDAGGDYCITRTISCTEPAEWLGYCPLNADLFAYQDRKRTLKICLLSDPTICASLSSDGDLTSIQWHPKLTNTLVFGDSAGIIMLVEVNPVAAGRRMKLNKHHVEFKHESGGGKLSGNDPICDIKFDPNSDNYALIAHKSGRMILGDIKSGQVISTFQQPGTAMQQQQHQQQQNFHHHQSNHTNNSGGSHGNHQSNSTVFIIQWMPHIPGGFLSTDIRAGIFHVWNVSQPHPLYTRRLLPSPIHIIQPLVPSHIVNANDTSIQQLKPYFIIAFDDGSIGLYNSSQNGRWDYLRYGGHTETIFACECLKSPSPVQLVDYAEDRRLLQKLVDSVFHPLLFATCSFDGTVKIWDLDNSTNNAPPNQFRSSAASVSPLTMTQYDTVSKRCQLNQIDVPQNVGRTSLQQDDCGVEIGMIDSFPLMSFGRKQADGTMSTAHGLWYSVSWSSDGSYRLAAGSNTGMIMVYDALQARVIGEYGSVHSAPVFRVSWNPHHRTDDKPYGGMLATSSADGTCAIMNPETGKLIRRLKHDDEVFGCDWSPINAFLLACGCKSGAVYVWDLSSTSSHLPLAKFKGHSMRVFNTAWSPLESDWLATVSDDCDIRVWSINEQVTISRLQGHTKNVRGLAWSPELRQILITGSWDSDIRVWNILDSTCLTVISGHAADVYGISFVSSNPLLLFSCSRDNTFRLWSMADLCNQSKWHCMRSMQRGRWQEAAACFGHLSNDEADNPPFAGGVEDQHWRYEGIFGRLLRYVITDPSVEPAEKWKRVMQFFSPLNGTMELWNMVISTVEGHAAGTLGKQQISKSLTLNPRDETLQLAELKAQLLETPSLQQQIDSGSLQVPALILGDPQFLHLNSSGGAIDGLAGGYMAALTDIPIKTRAQMQSLAEAAQLRLLMGQQRRYCELLCTLGYWERALAIAPVLGLDYWRTLLRRYTQRLMQTATSEIPGGSASGHQSLAANQALPPFLLAAGQPAELVDYFIQNHRANNNNNNNVQLQSAYLVASAFDAGLFEQQQPASTATPSSQPAVITNSVETNGPIPVVTITPARSQTASSSGGRLPSIRQARPSIDAQDSPHQSISRRLTSPGNSSGKGLVERVIDRAVRPSTASSSLSVTAQKHYDDDFATAVVEDRDSYSSKISAAWLLVGGDKRGAVQRLLDGRVYDHAYALSVVFGFSDYCQRIERAMHRYQ